MVGGESVAAEQGEVFDVRELSKLLAKDEIAKGYAVRSLARHAESDDERLARCRPALALGFAELAHAGIA